MRGHMKKAGMMPPTFESNRSANQFTARLLLHHLLDNDTIQWLAPYAGYSLNNEQRLALVFVREVGAIDNITYRQLNSDINTSKASADLHDMCKKGLLEQKGQSRSSYYIAGEQFVNGRVDDSLNSIAAGENSIGESLNSRGKALLNSRGKFLNSRGQQLPKILEERVAGIGKRAKPDEMKKLVIELCRLEPMSLLELANILKRKPSSLRYLYVNPLIESGELFYTIPEMLSHPDQKYTTVKNK